MSLYRGYIYKWGLVTTSREDIVQSWEALISDIAGVSMIQRFRPSEGNLGDWLICRYESRTPISDFHKNNPELRSERGFFEYSLIFRATKNGTIIIGSSGTKIVQHFIEENVNSKSYPELVAMRVKIRELVNYLVFENPGPFAVTSLSVNVDASGENIDRADYYGKDLGAAPLIYDNLRFQTPFLVGIRDRKKQPVEMLRIGSRGYISFSCSGQNDIYAIEEALSFLWLNNFYLG